MFSEENQTQPSARWGSQNPFEIRPKLFQIWAGQRLQNRYIDYIDAAIQTSDTVKTPWLAPVAIPLGTAPSRDAMALI